MLKFFTRLGIQAQFSIAMVAIGAAIVGSLVSTLLVSRDTEATFAELTTTRLPSIFAAVDAKAELNAVVIALGQVREAATEAEYSEASQRASAVINKATEAFDRIQASPNLLDAQRDILATSLPKLSETGRRMGDAVAARLTSIAELDRLWSEAQQLHANAIGDVTTVVDDAAFELSISAEETKETLSTSLEALLLNDVDAMLSLLRFQAAVSEVVGDFTALRFADEAATAAAASDRLESALQKIQTTFDSLPEDARAELDEDEKALAELARQAVARRATSFWRDLDDLAGQVFEVKGRLTSRLAELVDDASFNLTIAGSDLSETTVAEISALADATTGRFREMLGVEATLNSVIGAIGRMVTATDDVALALTVQTAEATRKDMQSVIDGALLEDPELVERLRRLAELMDDAAGVPSARASVLAADAAAQAERAEASALLSGLTALAIDYVESERALGDASVEAANEKIAQGRTAQLIASAIGIFTVFAVSFFFVRPRIVRPLREFKDAVSRLAEGEQAALPGEGRHDEIGQLARSMTEIYERGVEAARIRLALDNSSAMMLIAGSDNRILYLNDRLRDFLCAAETDIAEDLPGFAVDSLIGAPLDAAHKVDGIDFSDHVAALQAVQAMNMTLGGRRITLAAAPVRNAAGERLGSVVEWRDMTVELAVQTQIDTVVAAANHGDFSKRVDLNGAEGALRDMGANVNQLVESAEAGLSEASRVVSAIASGDLSEEMTGEFEGAFQRLQDDVNATVRRLRDLVAQIQNKSSAMSHRLADARSGAEDLSQRAEAQASSLEETAATMEEISSTIRVNTESAKSATDTSKEASSRAERGGAVVGEAVGAMDRIEKSSTQIAEIIGVIDSIAFQTNLLALNAAVEAARAGDAGKGFAVVASEVRTLAQRSSEAARDIRELISDSSNHVETGVRLVRETGEALSAIREAIRSVEDIVESIAGANQEQSVGVDEISSTISHLDSMTQSNSSLAESSAANAKTLAGDSQELLELVAFFKIGEEQTATVREADADEDFRAVANG